MRASIRLREIFRKRGNFGFLLLMVPCWRRVFISYWGVKSHPLASEAIGPRIYRGVIRPYSTLMDAGN
jgi:hypothetical protein